MKDNREATISAIKKNDAHAGNSVEQLLRNSDEWTGRLFALNNAAMLIINPATGKIVAANQASADFYGWSIVELEQKRIQQINMLPTEVVDAKMQQTQQTGGGTFEFMHKIADGTIKTVEVFSSRIELNDEQLLFSIIIDITDRKLVEAESNRQAGLILSLLDSVQDIVFFKDANSEFIGGNRRFAELIGRRPDEIAGKTDYDFFSVATAEKFREQDLEILNKKLSQHNEVEVSYPDGRTILVDTLKTPYWDGSGQLIGILGVSRDITERKIVENKLRDSEANFRLFFETIDDIIIIGDSQGVIIFANGAAQSKLGYTLEELLGMHVLDMHPLEKQAEAQQIFADMFAGLRRSCPLPLVRKNGVLIPVETRVWFGKWDGRDCVFGVSKDLSQQQAAYDMFHKLFDNNPALMAVSSLPDRKFVEVNTAFLDKLGFSREEVIGKTSQELDLFAENAKFIEVSDKLHQEERTGDVELAVRRKDGQIINGLFCGEIIDNQLEKSFLTVMTDITEIRQAESAQKRAERALQETNVQLETTNIAVNALALKAEAANVMKGQFLANMSHEIRTPMNAITGLTYLLLQSELTSQQRDFLLKIELVTRNLLIIINDILDTAKIEAGKLDVENIEFSVEELLENLTATAFVLAENKDQLEIIYDVSPNVPKRLIGDSLRLTQIMNNLVSNAIKFSSIGQVIVKLAVEKIKSEQIWLGISVTDTGLGISSEQQARLFRPFEQGDASTTRQYGGTGLGLALTKNLVELLGGSISVESQVGAGSVFSVSIPFGKSVEISKENADGVTTLRVQSIKTLVVVENLVLRVILQRELERLGCIVTTAQSGVAAQKLLEAGHVDSYYQLVLMDRRSLGESGAETIQQIRASKDIIQQPKIILLMNYSKAGQMNVFNDMNLDGMLLKPIASLALIKVIEDCFVMEEKFPDKRLSQLALDELDLSKIRGAKVLLVEDDPINQLVASEMLRLIGVDVIVASSGQVALSKIELQPFDLVLLDIQLPDIDGLEVARRARLLKSYADLPIIAMTANARASDVQSSLKAGMNEHLLKPIVAEHLYRSLIKWIALPPERKLAEKTAQQSAPSTETEIAFEKLVGFNVEVGLTRLGGKSVAYRNVLERFYQEYQGVFYDVENAWFDKDFDKITKIAHNLKGTAGNIGAVNLQAAALQLENSLINVGADNPSAALNNFETELTLILNSLENFFSFEVLNMPAVAAGGRQVQIELMALLGALASAVASNQPKPCRQILAEINSYKLTTEVAGKVDLIKAAVVMFDFFDAGKILAQLIRELESTHE
ncbi:MAG: PAS domain S-box protein [Bacillota bacterium]